jgi:hypothetical protein
MGINDDQLKALGRLTAEFSLLELMIASLAWRLSGDARSGMIFTSHLSFTRLCQATIALAIEKMKTTPAVADELEQITERALRLEDDRNRLIHSIWFELAFSDDPGAPPPEPGGPLSRIKITAKGKLKVQLQVELPPEDIYRVVDEIAKTAGDVVLFTRKYTLRKEEDSR